MENKERQEQERPRSRSSWRDRQTKRNGARHNVCERGSEKGLSLFVWAGLLNPNPAHLRLLK